MALGTILPGSVFGKPELRIVLRIIKKEKEKNQLHMLSAKLLQKKSANSAL